MFISLPRVVLNSSEALGAGPQIVQFRRRATHPPFQTRPGLTRTLNFISCYVNHHRNLYLSQTLHQHTKKKKRITGNHQINLPPTRGVGYLCSFSRIPTSIYHYRNSPGHILDFMSRFGHTYSSSLFTVFTRR